MTHFYLFKSHFIGLIKFFLKKLQDREKEKSDKMDIPLVDLNDDKKFSDNVQSITTKEKEEDILSERKQFLITFLCYIYVFFMAVSLIK